MTAGDEPEASVERRVEMTGWSTVALAVVCFLLAALEAAIPAVLRQLSAALAAGDSARLQATRAAFTAGAGTSAAINAVFGAMLSVVGVAVARRARWAHAAMVAAAWSSILLMAAIAGPSIAPLVAMAGGGAGTRAGIYVLTAILVFAQVGAVIWFLRFWLRPEVRALFR